MIRYLVLLLGLAMTGFAQEGPLVLPLDSADWQGERSPRRVDTFWEYLEQNPDKPAIFWLELPDPGLDHYDALEFRWQFGSSTTDAVVTVEGYPENSFRRYYLRKRPNPVGQWQKVFLSLRASDDKEDVRPEEAVPKGKIRLKFAIYLRDLEGVSNPKIAFRVGDLRFVRYPVRLHGDYTTVRDLHEPEQAGQLYPMRLENRTHSPQKVYLKANTEQLQGFEMKLPDLPIKLRAGETRELEVKIFTTAKDLPPLTFGAVNLFAWTEEHPDLPTTWFDSYFLNPIIGAVPPKPRPYPWFASGAARERALQNIQAHPKAKQFFENLKKEADNWIGQEIVLPKLYQGYSGFYVCKEHSSTLKYLGNSQHQCVAGNHLLKGNQTVDQAGDYLQHQKLSEASLTLARIGWLTQDARYSRKAAEILLAYARIFVDLPVVEKSVVSRHSRVASNTLGECWWFSPLPFAFDFVRGSGVLSADEDQNIVDRLILPAIMGIHDHRIAANQQAEVNRSVGTGAIVARNWPLAAEALEGEFGVRYQWRDDFDRDGMSVEREITYHFAAVSPFAEMLEAYEAVGVAAYSAEFRRLFEAPLAMAADFTTLAQHCGLYEFALTAWNDPAFVPPVAWYRQQKWTWAALVSPSGNINSADLPIGNSALPAGGYTTLRQPLADRSLTTAMINYGSPAWRGAKALLDPFIQWKQLPLNQRTLRIGYGYADSKFSETPAAGNGLIVDGAGGSMLRADQDAWLEKPCAAGRWTTPRERPQFEGVQWSRAVALCGNTALILDTFDAEQPRQFDLLLHLPGPLTAPLEAMDYPALLKEGDGYSYFRSPQHVSGELETLGYLLDAKRTDVSGSLTLLGNQSDIFLAQSPAEWHPKWVPVLVRRVQGKSGWAITALTGRDAAQTKEVKIRQLPVKRKDGRTARPHEALAAEVVNSEGRWLILSANANEMFEVDGISMTGHLDVKFFGNESPKAH